MSTAKKCVIKKIIQKISLKSYLLINSRAASFPVLKIGLSMWWDVED